MPQTMTEVDDFRKTINQASIEAIFQFAMHRSLLPPRELCSIKIYWQFSNNPQQF
jgi:hypothetical protein